MTTLIARARSLPTRPGVYLFHDDHDEVIYVGKAINLRSRVASYFRAHTDLPPAKRLMIPLVHRLEHILVRSETEALLLESTLIKKHRPKYNILLKDDKDFQYIKIALAEKFPSVSTVRRISLDGSRYFGPFTSGLAVRRTLRLLKRLFPYKNCGYPPDRPCFEWHLHRCLGHDTGPNSQVEYKDVIAKLMRFLEGQTGDIVRDVRRHMSQAAAQRDFELAAILRDRLQALEHVLEEQAVISARGGVFDVVSIVRQDSLAAINLFLIRQGKLVQRNQFMLQHTATQKDADVVAAFISQYYSQSTNHPPVVFAAVDIPQDIGRALGLNVKTARRGLKRQLITMGEENAQDFLEREKVKMLSQQARASLGIQELTAALRLSAAPHRIEMYDISNFQGSHAVGSMVVFEDGLPAPKHYRSFRIKSIRGPDDGRMLSEVLGRRFRHTGPGWTKPDLVMLDGGLPQLNAVHRHVGHFPKDVPLAALAKREEELFRLGRTAPIRLPASSAGLLLIQQIRDEAHRSAIGYYRRRHRASSIRSVLDDIPGLGPTMKRRLLNRFGTVTKIRQASEQELTAVVGQTMAVRLAEHL